MKKPRQLVQVEVLCQPTVGINVTNNPLTNIDINNEIIPGVKGTTFIPSVSSEGVISWTNDGNLPNPDPVSIIGSEGPQGPQGEDGFSPSAQVTKSGTTVTITITDKTGTTSEEIESYSVPAGGIPKTDLASDVQESLSKADTAIQSIDFSLIDCGTSDDDYTPVDPTIPIPRAEGEKF